MLSRSTYIFLFLSIFLFSFSCKDNLQNPIPNVPINRSFNIGSPENAALNAVGGYIIVPEEGYGGLILVRATYEDMYAFDMQCTHDPYDIAGRTVENGVFLTCNICQSEFITISGQVSKGPASIPLKPYSTSFNGQIVYVNN